jgi:hypothetical protein
MRTAFIRRGPWGYVWERHPVLSAVADWRMTTLAEFARHRGRGQPVSALIVVFLS